MKAYVSLANYNGDKGITTYSVFMQTAHGVICDTIDIHESELEEYNTQENDLECVKVFLKKKYKMSISLTFVKSKYHVIW